MKKVISAILSLFVIISAFCFTSTAFAYEETLIKSANFSAVFDSEEGVITISGRDALYFFTAPSFQEVFEKSEKYDINDVRKVVILEGITVIDRDTFSDMIKLEEITLPESLVKINSNAFRNCRKLKTINYAGDEDDWKNVVVSQRGNSLFLKAKVYYSAYVEESREEYYDTFDVIECDGAVYDFKTAELKIEADGYIDQSRIVDAWFGTDDNVDYKPICVEKLVVDDGAIKLGSDMMAGCDSLEYVSIPESVTTIEKGCFYGCKALSAVYYEGSKSDWSKIRIEDEDNDSLLEARMQYGEEAVVSKAPILIALILLFAVSSLLVILATRKRKE